MTYIMENEVLLAILDSLTEPIVFVDNTHTIRYMNEAAARQYEKRGGKKIIGNSIFEYHNANSRDIIMEHYQRLEKGMEEESYISTVTNNRKLFIRAVRDAEGKMIGYYERYEKA